MDHSVHVFGKEHGQRSTKMVMKSTGSGDQFFGVLYKTFLSIEILISALCEGGLECLKNDSVSFTSVCREEG